ncbi:MAG: hypothetical protein J1E83_05175 [Lachnospiraceae bacterium]|nr:hypothetical protein [Lachnospiraceae bacterium]
MKNKLLLLGMTIALTLVWITPIQSEAACKAWQKYKESEPYCATPVCTMAIPSQFTDVISVRTCDPEEGESGVIYEFKTEKVDHGCCDHK